MNDRVDAALTEAMESVGELAPEAPPLPSTDAKRQPRPLVVVAAAFASIMVVVGLSTLAFTSLQGSQQQQPTASPTTSTPTSNVFTGTWISDDLPIGTELRLSIDTSGAYDTWDETVISGECAGGTVTAEGTGAFQDETFVTPRTNRVCHPADNSASFPMADIDTPLTYLWDGTNDTLTLTIDGGCYYRLGTDPSVCDN